MNKEKIEYYAHLTITVLGLSLAVILVLRYLFVPILPFVIAYTLSSVLTPISYRIKRHTHISERIIRVLLATLSSLFLIGLLIFGLFYLLSEAWLLISDLISNDSLPQILSKITNPLALVIGEGMLGEDVEGYLNTTIKEALSDILSGIVSLLGSVVRGIPSVLLFVLVTVVATIYFSYDLDRINRAIKKILPKAVISITKRVKSGFIKTGGKYVRSYLLLSLITYITVLIGFLILGIEKAPLLALISAVLDILPIVGTGVILLPMSVYYLFFGNTGVGVGILVLFTLYQILRQIIEPRIVGKSLGVHPLVSLVLIYVGYGVFGIVGLFLMPLVPIILAPFWNKDNTAEVEKRTDTE